MSVSLQLGRGFELWLGEHSPTESTGVVRFKSGTIAAYACGLDELTAGYVFRAVDGPTQLPGLSAPVELLLAVTTAKKLARLGNALAFIADNFADNIANLSPQFWRRMSDAIERRNFALTQVEYLLATEAPTADRVVNPRLAHLRRPVAR